MQPRARGAGRVRQQDHPVDAQNKLKEEPALAEPVTSSLADDEEHDDDDDETTENIERVVHVSTETVARLPRARQPQCGPVFWNAP